MYKTITSVGNSCFYHRSVFQDQAHFIFAFRVSYSGCYYLLIGLLQCSLCFHDSEFIEVIQSPISPRRPIEQSNACPEGKSLTPGVFKLGRPPPPPPPPPPLKKKKLSPGGNTPPPRVFFFVPPPPPPPPLLLFKPPFKMHVSC